MLFHHMVIIKVTSINLETHFHSVCVCLCLFTLLYLSPSHSFCLYFFTDIFGWPGSRYGSTDREAEKQTKLLEDVIFVDIFFIQTFIFQNYFSQLKWKSLSIFLMFGRIRIRFVIFQDLDLHKMFEKQKLKKKWLDPRIFTCGMIYLLRSLIISFFGY